MSINFEELYKRYEKSVDKNTDKVTFAILANCVYGGTDITKEFCDNIKASLVSITRFRKSGDKSEIANAYLRQSFYKDFSTPDKLPVINYKYDVILVISGFNKIYDKTYFNSRVKRLKSKYGNIMKYFIIDEDMSLSELRKFAVDNCDSHMIQFIDFGSHLDILNFNEVMNQITDPKFGFLITQPIFVNPEYVEKLYKIALTRDKDKYNGDLISEYKRSTESIHRFHDCNEVDFYTNINKKYFNFSGSFKKSILYDEISVFGTKISIFSTLYTYQQMWGTKELVEANRMLTVHDYLFANSSVDWLVTAPTEIHKINSVDFAINYQYMAQTPWNVELLKIVYEVIKNNSWFTNMKEDTIANSIARKILEVGGINCKWIMDGYYYSQIDRQLIKSFSNGFKHESDIVDKVMKELNLFNESDKVTLD